MSPQRHGRPRPLLPAGGERLADLRGQLRSALPEEDEEIEIEDGNTDESAPERSVRFRSQPETNGVELPLQRWPETSRSRAESLSRSATKHTGATPRRAP